SKLFLHNRKEGAANDDLNDIEEFRKSLRRYLGTRICSVFSWDELGQKAWQKFKRRDAKITALTELSILTLEQDKKPLTATSDLVRYIGAFAVDVFNKCSQMYINKGNKKNVSDAKIMDCKYLKFEEDYLFYVTLKAIEQGIPGVYETTIKCEFDDGAISLDTFVLKYRKPSGTVKGAKFSPESTYETVTDGSTEPEVSFYPVSGMVLRRNKGGGYDFRHPRG
nr:hypothetical protein [Tanacetum cinerariifolium]